MTFVARHLIGPCISNTAWLAITGINIFIVHYLFYYDLAASYFCCKLY